MDQWTEKLDAYLDGELSGAETQKVDSHLRECPTCTGELAQRLSLKYAVRAAGKRYAPSPEFRESMRRKYLHPAPARAWRTWLLPAVVVMILFAIGIPATYISKTRMQRQQRYAEIADLYVGTLASANPVDVISSDKHTVKPWFEGKVPFTFNLPELQNSDFILLGGRVVYLQHAPGAELLFQIRKHRLSVFIFQEQEVGLALPNSAVATESAFHLQTWTDHGLRYFVISDAGAADIDHLTAILKNAAGS